MMNKFLSKLVRITTIIAVLCSGYLNVLCYGQDGHISIEPVFHNHCGHDEHEHDEQQGQDSGFLSTCSPCEDVLISNEIGPVRVNNPVLNSINLSNSFFSATRSCYTIGLNDIPISTFFAPLSSIRLLT